jgi:cytosine permease
LAWAFGSAVALLVEFYAPQLSTAISAALAGGIAYVAISMLPSPARAAA